MVQTELKSICNLENENWIWEKFVWKWDAIDSIINWKSW